MGWYNHHTEHHGDEGKELLKRFWVRSLKQILEQFDRFQNTTCGISPSFLQSKSLQATENQATPQF